MDIEYINNQLVFLRKYVKDLETYDESTDRKLAKSNKTKSEIIDSFLESIKFYESLLG